MKLNIPFSLHQCGSLRAAFWLAAFSIFLVGCQQSQPDETAAPAVTATETSVPATPVPATLTATPVPEPETLVPAGVPGDTYLAAYPLSIQLDGKLDDWEGVPMVELPAGAADLGLSNYVVFAAAADDSFLYLMGNVVDDNIITGEHGENYWNEDSIEFYLNGTNDLELNSYRDGVAQITIPPLNIGRTPDQFVFGGINHETVEVSMAIVESEAGYILELAIPLKSEVWNIPLFHGSVLGFQVHLNGASTANRDRKYIWSNFDTNDSSYYDPSVFGEIIFFEIGREEVARVEPERTPIPTFVPVDPGALYRQADAPIADRVEDLLARMSLEEKIGQMTLVEKNSIAPDDLWRLGIGGLLSGGGGYPEGENTPESWISMVDSFQEKALESRLGVPLIYGADGVHGHGNLRDAVLFPHNIGLGAANNLELMERIGRATALEMAATGVYWNYAPAVSVPQDIRWGRTYEGYSENPAIVSNLGAAYLRGLQGDDLSLFDTILGTPKHFVGDGGTAWGSSTTGGYRIDQGVTEVDETTLRAVHLPPYPAAIDAGARSIMISFSSWGGMKMHAQKYLITDVLKGELGFDGFVVSDWAGIDQISPDYTEAVVAAINAGIDMNMVPYNYTRFIDTLSLAVQQGDVPVERIDDAVRRILTVKFELGLFERPFAASELVPAIGSQAHRDIARQAVAESLVLLKNDGALLPLEKDAARLFVGGNAADDIGIQAGGWTIEWQGLKGDITAGTTILEGIAAAAGADTEVVFAPSGRFGGQEPGPEDICIAVVGEEPYAEGVGDSDQLSLPIGVNRALRSMEDSCENLVVILVTGRPVIVTDFVEKWDALVAAWLPGTEGQGVSDVLFGDLPFTGRLPVTWPASVDQLENPESGVPLFPFGFGLGE